MSTDDKGGRCRWEKDDGGREAAGFPDDGEGGVGDCVCRAIAIATGKPYREVYDALVAGYAHYAKTSRSREAKLIREGRKRCGADRLPDHGCSNEVSGPYLKSIGWQYTAIPNKRTVRLRADELPPGRLIVDIDRHYLAVIDGVIRDTFDSGRSGRRSINGYWTSKQQIIVTTDLNALAVRIRHEHGACASAIEQGCQHAITAGRLLAEAKAQLKHGGWLPWLRDHCGISQRTAQVYMQLARLVPNAQRVADLPLRRAVLKLQQEAREKKRHEELECPPVHQAVPVPVVERPPAKPTVIDLEAVADDLIEQLLRAAWEVNVSSALLLSALLRRLGHNGSPLKIPGIPPMEEEQQCLKFTAVSDGSSAVVKSLKSQILDPA
jgi:hypothetical protein